MVSAVASFKFYMKSCQNFFFQHRAAAVSTVVYFASV